MADEDDALDDGYADGGRYGWFKGDIQHVRKGSGGPLISEEELARILGEAPTGDRKPRTIFHIHRRRR